MTVLLVYAGWAAAPIMAYAALSHGLRRALTGFLALIGGYSVLVWLTWAALVRGAGGPVAPLAVIGPWAGVALLSVLLYALGAWIGRDR
ncbi:hypothetical protein [Rhodovulum strictum]|uniref:Uncharacterized protein n=1 Tax=Rhodovulum strictum TaxID=58314 RepID=A0A844BNA9_9RHOB|nr:hypothetical protein [Rhodovulum strictum]MRH21447.1 hypothetical protein [Rhodovulum strictum]